MLGRMNVVIKEEIDLKVEIVDEEEQVEGEEFLSLQQNNQDNWSDTDNCQFSEKLLPFEFIKLDPIEEEYKYIKKEYEEVLDLNQQNFHLDVEENSEGKSSDLENASPRKISLFLERIQGEANEQSNHKFLSKKGLETENTCNKNIIDTRDEVFKRNSRFLSLLRPELLLVSGANSLSCESLDEALIIKKLSEKSPEALSEFRFSLWRTAQIILRREQDRKRKALRRAQETEEERNTRRQKERLARAERRARESMEKKLLRRERDRKAKALARAMGLKGKRRKKLGKNKPEEAEFLSE